MVDFSRLSTARLRLTRPICGDLDELHRLLADPGVWEHFPSLRHTDLAQAAERAGLHLVWRGVDVGNPDPSAVRLVYADRGLDDAVVNVLVQHE